MQSSKLVKNILVMCCGLAPVVATAHHSTTEFDQSKVVEIDGVIVDVFWRNPHVVIKVAANMDDSDEVWRLEGASVSNLRRRGLTRDMLNEGDFVRAAGYASTRQDSLMLLSNLLLPSGNELLVRGNSGPRFAATADRRREPVFSAEQIAAAEAKADSIFRVWTWGRAERGWWFFAGPERFPLTEKGLATLKGYDEYRDNPVLKCIPPGMPATMGNPYPMTFTRVGDNIEYRSEEFDILRTIHIDGDPDADVEASPLGYSIGHWEAANTLTIRTTKISAPYFNRVGVKQTPDVVVDERFVFEASLRHHEERHALDSRRCPGDASQGHVHNVLSEILVAARDENLAAANVVVTVVGWLGGGSHVR
jgi:hypothetical protein